MIYLAKVPPILTFPLAGGKELKVKDKINVVTPTLTLSLV